MSIQLLSRRGLAFILVWVLSLAAAGFVGTAWAQRSNSEPQILSGSDIGFRVDGIGRNGTKIGTLVARVDGKWVEVEFGSAARIVR